MSDNIAPSSLDLKSADTFSVDNEDDAENVTLRSDRNSLRRTRTPTAIVSDVFTFLDDHDLPVVDAVEEGSLDQIKGQVHENAISHADGDASSNEALETDKGMSKHCDRLQNEKCLPQTDSYLSKDSGFASLERHLHGDDLLSFDDSLSCDSQDHLSSTNENDSHNNSSEVQHVLDFQVSDQLLSAQHADTTEHNVELGDCADSKTSGNQDEDSLRNTPHDAVIEEGVQDVSSSASHHDESDCNSLGETETDKHEILSSSEIGSNKDVNNSNSETAFRDKNVSRESTEIDTTTNEQECDVNVTLLEAYSEQKEDGRLDDEECLKHVPTPQEVEEDEEGLTVPTSFDKNEVCNDDPTQELDEDASAIITSNDTDENNRGIVALDLVLSSEDKNGEQLSEVEGSADVDMRKKPDVIPASPVKCATKVSKSGLLLEANPATEQVSDDSSDEDIGIYAESFRRSNWVRVSGEEKRSVKKKSPRHSPRPLREATQNTPSERSSQDVAPEESSNNQDEVFPEPLKSGPGHNKLCHTRSDSVTTTDSEQEFQTRYILRRKCLIQRADSQQEYHRLSARLYDEDKEVILERNAESEDLGLHLLDSHPTYITSVDAGSPAEKAGIVEGQILVTVNDLNVLLTDHHDIIKLIQDCTGPLKLGVASTDFQPIRDLQAPVITGHMYKLGTNSLVRMWKKRFFVLRNDNCLYYYKSDQDLDPLGALPLAGYTISRHTDTSKDFCFKAEKYRARTYYFMTENRDQLTEWVACLTEAALRSKKQKESSSFMSVSSHNVSLPALDIRRPECSGYLLKLSPHSRTWRRRYCLLKDACVYYYKDVNSFSALGVAHLHGYTVDVAGHGRKKNSFSLRPPDAKMRQFVFGADNETDKKRWVEAIIHSIQRWVPVDKGSEC